jgi:hypothetical protein
MEVAPISRGESAVSEFLMKLTKKADFVNFSP